MICHRRDKVAEIVADRLLQRLEQFSFLEADVVSQLPACLDEQGSRRCGHECFTQSLERHEQGRMLADQLLSSLCQLRRTGCRDSTIDDRFLRRKVRRETNVDEFEERSSGVPSGV